MKKALLMFAVLLILTPIGVRADVSLLVLEAVGVAGEFTGSGHTAIYFSNICADGPTRLRLCEPGEAGAVISAYPGIGKNISLEWIAVPLVPYLYGVEDPRNVPLYANGAVRSFLRNNYRKERLSGLIPDNADGSTPEGRWAAMLAMTFNRDIYGFNIKTSREEDAEFLKEFNTSPPNAKFNSFTRNCADFTRKVMNRYFPGAAQRDVLNDFGITTPKALARSVSRFAKSRPGRLFHVTKYSQVAGTIWKSYDNRNFTEKAITSKKYIIPALVFYPPIFAVFGATYLATGQYDIHSTYEEYATPEIARLNLDRSIQRDTKKGDPQTKAVLKEIALRKQGERAGQLGHHVAWDTHRVRFDKILNAAIDRGIFQDLNEVKTFFKDLELMSAPRLDESGAPILKVNYYGRECTLGITRRNILSPSTHKELAYKLMLARIYADLMADDKNRSSFADFRSDWDIMDRLSTHNELLAVTPAIGKTRGRFVQNRPAMASGKVFRNGFITATK